jgi:hypothetical protein
MSSLLLSRLHFASWLRSISLSCDVHWPRHVPSSGVSMHLRTRNELYERIYHFWSIIFALGFGMGVVSVW